MEPRIYVDFNEMVSDDVVLLSKTDSKMDSSGHMVTFIEGQAVAVYMDDLDENGNPDPLLADGVAMRNRITAGWGAIARWVLKIDGRGIRHSSEEFT